MFDPKKLVTPLNIIINDVTPDITGLVLNKLQYRVIELNQISPYRNTSAKLKYFRDENDLEGEIRNIEYNRINIGEYIEKNAKFEINYDGKPTYVLVTDDIEVSTKNAGPALVSKILNKEYGLPILENDLTMVKQPEYYLRPSSFGELYLLSNAVVAGDTITYLNGKTSVYHLPDTQQYSYNKVTATQCGVSFYRKWDTNELFEITLPNVEDADGWSTMIEDVSAIDSVGNGSLWINLKYNSIKGSWSYLTNDGVHHEMVVTTIGKLRVTVTNDGIVIKGLSLVNNNAYVEQFSFTVPGNGYSNGLNRITIYSNNPLAAPISYKFNATPVSFDGPTTLIPNLKEYTNRDSVIVASPKSNGVFGEVKYPIRVTKYDTSGYLQVASLDKFIGTDTHVGKVMIATLDKFTSNSTLIYSMNIQNLGKLFIDGVITKLAYTITTKSDLTVRHFAEMTVKEIASDGVILEVKSYINGFLALSTSYKITETVETIVVRVSNNNIIITDGNNDIITYGVIGFYSYTDVVTDKSLKIKMEMEIDKKSPLPTISVNKQYTPTNEL